MYTHTDPKPYWHRNDRIIQGHYDYTVERPLQEKNNG